MSEPLPPEYLLELDDVSRVYGDEVKVHALKRVTLRIRAGDFLSIIGPSGSGKSTMLGLLGCLDRPTSGAVRIGDRDVTALDDATRSALRGESIGFVFQQFHLIPHLSASANVETALLYRGVPPGERRDRALAALEAVGLDHRADHRPAQLSGGEQQRVGAALGAGIVIGTAKVLHWTVILAYRQMPIWIGLAVAVSAAAGLSPSIKAARLEPLETLRLT